MKKIAFVLAVLMILLCSCTFNLVLPGTEESTETGSVPETPDHPATEPVTGPPTEPADTTPAIVPDPDGDAAAYEAISAKAEGDVRFRFVKAYIDGDGDEMIRTLEEVDYYSPDGTFDQWIKSFENYRKTFKITRYSAIESTAVNEYGAEEERVVFAFSVYESNNDILPVGEREMIITNSFMDSTVWVTDSAISEKNEALSALVPEDAELVWRAIPCYRMIGGGYTDEWSGDVIINDTIFLTLPGVEYADDAPGMSADQITAAAKELFGVDVFNVIDPPLYVGEDGLYHAAGHGGCACFYELLSAEKDGDGFIVRMRQFADKAYIVPSDVYEIRIKPSDGLYKWVFDHVKILEMWEPAPYVFSN